MTVPHLDIETEYHACRAAHGLPPHDGNSETDLRIRGLFASAVIKGINHALLSVKEETGVEGHAVVVQ